MARPSQNHHQPFLSPVELSFLYSSLTLDPPIRADGRSPAQFRPLEADVGGVIATANGSARVCFPDGSEAIAAIKLELQRSPSGSIDDDDEDGNNSGKPDRAAGPLPSLIEVAVDMTGPGAQRDDEPVPIQMASVLTEALAGSAYLRERLQINSRFHWKLYADILLLSGSRGGAGGGAASYPLPLLSFTTHLALLDARVPKLVSEREEDPLFSDDWALAPYLYPRAADAAAGSLRTHYPPVTLLVAAVGETVLFDPIREELAVADGLLAISVEAATGGEVGGGAQPRLISVRMIDPPSRYTPSGVPDSLLVMAGKQEGSAAAGAAGDTLGPLPAATSAEAIAARQRVDRGTVWSPPRGGLGRAAVAQVLDACLRPETGVAAKVLASLRAVA